MNKVISSLALLGLVCCCGVKLAQAGSDTGDDAAIMQDIGLVDRVPATAAADSPLIDRVNVGTAPTAPVWKLVAVLPSGCVVNMATCAVGLGRAVNMR